MPEGKEMGEGRGRDGTLERNNLKLKIFSRFIACFLYLLPELILRYFFAFLCPEQKKKTFIISLIPVNKFFFSSWNQKASKALSGWGTKHEYSKISLVRGFFIAILQATFLPRAHSMK